MTASRCPGWLGVRSCNYCVSGWETVCYAQETMGYAIDGGMGEYATAYTDYVVKVPEGVDPFDAAPLTCAGVTTYKAVKVAFTRSSDFVAVFGVGGLGHLAIQCSELHAAGKTRAIRETRPLDKVNEAIADVEAGQIAARIVLEP